MRHIKPLPLASQISTSMRRSKNISVISILDSQPNKYRPPVAEAEIPVKAPDEKVPPAYYSSPLI